MDNEIDHNSTYELEQERERVHAVIWKRGTDNCKTEYLEYYRALCLELEYRDSQAPKAELHVIGGTWPEAD